MYYLLKFDLHMETILICNDVWLVNQLNNSRSNISLSSLKEFLPKEYIKQKGEKRIFQVSSGLWSFAQSVCVGLETR